MKDFTYTGNYCLHHSAYDWLTIMGLRETLWILDADWISYSYDITYGKWIK